MRRHARASPRACVATRVRRAPPRAPRADGAARRPQTRHGTRLFRGDEGPRLQVEQGLERAGHLALDRHHLPDAPVVRHRHREGIQPHLAPRGINMLKPAQGKDLRGASAAPVRGARLRREHDARRTPTHDARRTTHDARPHQARCLLMNGLRSSLWHQPAHQRPTHASNASSAGSQDSPRGARAGYP